MKETYKSRVYTDRPTYADFDAPSKFSAIQSIIAKRLRQHPKAICSYSGGSDSDILIDLIERTRAVHNLPPVKYVFFNTGLEMQATKDHVKAVAEKYAVEIEECRPKVNIVTASRTYGIPFVSKIMSAGLSEWQKKGVPLSIAEEYELAEDKVTKRQELRERYPKCESLINFLCCCNSAGEPRPNIQLVINSSKFMRDFIEKYPPDFLISAKCCDCCKKQLAHRVQKGFDMIITGERRDEGGMRSVPRKDNTSLCFTETSGGQYRLRPLYYVSDSDKAWYKDYYGIRYSDAYEVYGLTRTGCCGCPISHKAVNDLEKIRPYEPNVVKAAWNIFGKSYEYRQKYNEYKAKRLRDEKAEENPKNQLSLFESGGMTYLDFLRGKIELAQASGFDVSQSEINPALKPHQRDAVIWAVKGGRRALFESFGLGKTAQELEFCHLVVKHEGGQALIVLPLGVRQEFRRDAVELLGMEEPPYVRTLEEARQHSDSPILLTNYERVRDGDIDPTAFTATVLDEASVLRSFGSKTYQTFLDKFKGVKYKLVATATPSPNKYKEMIHYAGYLEIMDTGQALTRFFQRDSTKANNLTIYPHKEDEFWLWVSSWALVLTTPSDLSYPDDGYALPPLEVRRHVVTDRYNDTLDRDGQYKIINDVTMSLQTAAAEKRDSIDLRVAKAKEIVDSDPDAHFLLWHDQEAERHAIKAAIPGTVDIYGSMDYDERERRVVDFSEGRTRLFATKKSLSGSGCNFQRYCHRAIFVGIDYEFNDFIQAIHRIYRFLQTEQVIIDIICTEAEDSVYRKLMEKWEQHNHLQQRMREIVKKYGLGGVQIAETMARSIGVKRVEITGKNFVAVNNDCVEETARMEENSVDCIITSIPFSNHYEYTPSYNDFGHNQDTVKFFEQMDYLTPNLLRVLKPGRVFACHVKDRVLFGNATGMGMPTMEPFHAQCIQHYMRHGFAYFGMITVVTDVVRENNQTYRLGWTEQCKDGTKMGVGCPEYILLFRKLPTDRSKAYADEPVAKAKEDYTRAQWQIDAHGYWRSSGDRLLTKRELEQVPVDRLQAAYRKYSRGTVYSYEDHVALAKRLDEDGHLPATFMVVAPGSWSPDVWDDVNRMRTLNTTQSQRRQQLHVCPLQLDIVDRLIERYTNPGELVLDPFGGIGTVALQAIKKGRRGYTIELNNDYFRDAVGYLEEYEQTDDNISLFDFVEGAL